LELLPPWDIRGKRTKGKKAINNFSGNLFLPCNLTGGREKGKMDKRAKGKDCFTVFPLPLFPFYPFIPILSGHPFKE
jgi:hypothetical protein